MVDQFEKILSEAELQRARRFVYPEHQRSFILARYGLRQILADYLDCAPENVYFQYGEHGKPHVDPKRHATSLRFNLSHSGDIAVLAVTDTCEVGVDVEYVKKELKALDIARRYFSPKESAALESVSLTDQQLAFFQGWTRKEALLKALGVGLHFPLKDCEVSLLPKEPAKIISVVGHPEASHDWSIYSFSPKDDFIVAVVMTESNDNWEVQQWHH